MAVADPTSASLALDDLLQISRIRAHAVSGTARAMREGAGISLREFAGTLGVSPPTLSFWETGAVRPPAERALRWARALAHLNDLDELPPAPKAAPHADALPATRAG